MFQTIYQKIKLIELDCCLDRELYKLIDNELICNGVKCTKELLLKLSFDKKHKYNCENITDFIFLIDKLNWNRKTEKEYCYDLL